MKSLLRTVAVGVGAALMITGVGHSTAVAKVPVAKPAVEVAATSKIRVVQYPKRVRIGNTLGSACSKKVRVKISKNAAPAGVAVDLIYTAFVVASPTPMEVHRIRNVKPGRTYKLFPIPAPQYGEGYKITLCGDLASQVRPLASPSQQVGTLSVDLVPAGEGANNPYATQIKSIKIDWRGQAS